MTEDKRIREIRDALAVCDNDVSVPYEYLSDTVRAVLSVPPPAPRVFFPGDTVPRGAAAVNEDGDLVAGAHRVMAIDGPVVEVVTPTPEEWQAAVDRAHAERPEVQP